MSGAGRTLVGRERELEALTGVLDRAAAGRGGVALVSGEPGIGKTRLCEEIATRAAARGFAVAWGRAWEVGHAPSYWPWIEAMRALFARPGGRGPAADAVVALLPELGGRAAATGAGAVDPFQLFDAVAGALRAAAEREPVLVVLDDLHAADPSSLQLAEFVARAARGARVALVASHRDLEARRSPAIEAALARLGRGSEAITLPRLAADDVAMLVHEATGREDREAARMIHDATEGNPLFVQELLRLLAARGAAGGGVPAGVRTVIRERLALLTPATVALLQAASLVGREFGLAVAAEVAGVTPAALEEAAAEARGAELLVDAGPGRLRFSHALVAETLAGELPEPVRARLHRRAAEALERWHAGDPAAPFDDIARHWLAAGADAAPRALEAACRAAAGASARLAFADAALLYERALAALALVAPGDARRRAELLLARGDALVRAGDRAEAERACHDAAELARALADPALLARAALAFGAEIVMAQAEPTLIRMLESALDAQPEGDGPWRARVMARLAAARQPALDPRGPMELAREAIAMARRLGDDAVRLEVVHSASGALMDFALPEERAPINEEVARLAAAAGDRPRHLRSLVRLVFDQIELADLAGFEAALARYEAAAAETRQPRYLWMVPMFRAMRAAWEGRLAEDARLVAEAHAMYERSRDTSAVPQFEVRRAILAVTVGDLEHARELARGRVGRVVDESTRAFLKLFTDLAGGDRAAAEDVARRIDGYGLALHLEDVHVAELVAELAWVLRDRARAAALTTALAPRAGKPFMVTGIGFLVTGLVDQGLMRCAAVLGRWDDVDRHARDALAVCARLGARLLEARVRADFAEALVERGDAEGRARAAEQVAEARRLADDIGVPGVLRQCDGLAARLAGVPAPAAAPAPAAPATPAGVRLTLEGEYWTVEGAGELCRIKDSRGMQMLAALVAEPGREHHVLDLSGASEPVDGGDAGETLDREARAAYEARLRELREELAEAAAWNDAGRRARLEEEAQAIAGELAGAFGLGGRARATGSAVERARSNVRRRLTDAIGRIEEACPRLGKQLRRAVRTGITCAYEPG